MCYETAQLAYQIYKEAKRLNADPDEIERLREKWKKLAGDDTPKFYHVSGYEHPKLAVFTSKSDVESMEWGLIPHWAKDVHSAMEIRSKTLNARGETLFEKPAFRDAAVENRIILPLDGFFEHFHKNKKTFPHFIQRKDGQRMFVGAIASIWEDALSNSSRKTFSIVTTAANSLMADIHNNPKLKGPRMPLLLDEGSEEQWLHGTQKEAEELIQPNTQIKLQAHTVRRLRGKNAVGNTSEAHKEYNYDEMIDPLTLF